jgi:WD40 repeat protein
MMYSTLYTTLYSKLYYTMVVAVGAVKTISFDSSGLYLAFGGGSRSSGYIQIKVVKDWSSAVTMDHVHDSAVQHLHWLQDARGIVSSSSDGIVKVFSKKD